MKKLKNISLLALTCFSFVLVSKVTKEPKTAKAWVGVTYMLAEEGASNEHTAAVGAFGTLHSAMHGAIWGTAFGGPAGAVAGVVVGL